MENKFEMTIVKDSDSPGAKIAGVNFDCLCEYVAKGGTTICVYGKENSNEVVVELNNTNAIVDLFSTKPEEIGRLFDYIDVTRARKDWLGGFSSDLHQYFKLDSHGNDQINKAAYQPNNRPFLDKVLGYFRIGSSLDKSLSDAIQMHTVRVDHVKSIDYDGPEYAGVFDPYPIQKEIIAAASLPAGWNWEHYKDGSGSLHSPEGRSYFSYDEAPYHSTGGIEYQYDHFSHWGVFWGPMAEFEEYAESEIARELSMEAGKAHREELVDVDRLPEKAHRTDSFEPLKAFIEEQIRGSESSQEEPEL